MEDLFGEGSSAESGGEASLPTDAPLAARMRPRSLEEYVGQEHILGHGKLLRRAIEADRLSAAWDAIHSDGFSDATRGELFRAAHDIKGDAVTFGFPSASAAANSLCRIIEHAPDLSKVPTNLIMHHINAVQAIVRERTMLDTIAMANELSRQLRGIADEFLTKANHDRPEHLEAILAPSIVPVE